MFNIYKGVSDHHHCAVIKCIDICIIEGQKKLQNHIILKPTILTRIRVKEEKAFRLKLT